MTSKSTIPEITAEKFYRIPQDYKGIYEDIHGLNPDWKGRRTALMGCITGKANCGLGIEDIHFKVIGNYKPNEYEEYCNKGK